MKLFNFPITTIFAREVLEAALVVGQFRTVVLRSPEWEDPEKRREGLRAITNAAIIASLVALVIVVAVSVPLVIKGNDLDPKIVQIIEGVSKPVCYLSFSFNQTNKSPCLVLDIKACCGCLRRRTLP